MTNNQFVYRVQQEILLKMVISVLQKCLNYERFTFFAKLQERQNRISVKFLTEVVFLLECPGILYPLHISFHPDFNNM